MSDASHPTARLAPAPPAEVACQACPVACERVVDPSGCIEGACPNLYCYEDWQGRRFVGCLERVFAFDLDLDLLEQATRRGGFGSLRCARPPLPVCRAGVERAYPDREDALGCVNPEFFEPPEGAFRLFLGPGSG